MEANNNYSLLLIKSWGKKETACFAQDYTNYKWQGQDLNPNLSKHLITMALGYFLEILICGFLFEFFTTESFPFHHNKAPNVYLLQRSLHK